MRRAIRSCVLLCLLGAGAAAAAQDAANAPPAERLIVSPGGVDMRSGRYAYDQTDLAIGGESGGLTLSRSLTQPVAGHNNPFGNFSHNWEVLLSEKRISIAQNKYTHQSGSDYQIEIAFGGLSQTFRGFGAAGYPFDQTSRAGFGSLTYSGDRNGAGAVYTFTGGDGTQAVFRAIGSADCSSVLRCAYVSHITQPDGTRLDFEYDNQGGNATRLRSVTSSRGYALLLEYGGALVAKACLLNLAAAPKPANNVCPAGALAATYAYASVGGVSKLASATDGGGAIWGFTYSGTDMGFVRPGEATPWLTNATFPRTDNEGLVTEHVGAQSFADGSAYGYVYDVTPFVPLQASQIAGGSYTDNLGNQTVLRFDFPVLPNPGAGGGSVGGDDDPPPQVYQLTPGPVEVIDPLGRVTRADYCDPQAMANLNGLHRCIVMPMPVSTTDAEGIRTEMVWDMFARNLQQSRRIARPGSLQPNGQPWPNIVTSATYLCGQATTRLCNEPLTRTDARGAVTDYVYAPEHGGLTSETGPAPTPGAPRPQTRHHYAQRHAWFLNASGAFEAAPPVWVRTATSTCRTSAATGNPAAPCAAGALDEVYTAYDYGANAGPNNLLLRGQAVTAESGGVMTTLRTCYTHDARGRKIGEIQPNANLASCPAALAGAAPYANATRYDAAGRVTGAIAPDPDGAGPLKHAAVRNSYDAAGRLVKVETGELAAWQLENVAPLDWPGFTVHRTLETSYDAMSRKTRELVREGAAGAIRWLTEYRYDEIGRLKCTAVRMDPATFGLPPHDACTPRTPAGSQGPDRITRNVYDAAGQRLQLREGVGSDVEAAEATWAYNANGQVTTVIDGNGNRAELRYDGHGRQDRWTFPSTTRPSAYNDSTHATALASAGSVNAGDYEAYEYDLNSNRTALIKRDGSRLDYEHDALNRVIVKIVPERLTGPQALTTAQTRDTFYSYDLRNLQLSARFDSVTGEGVTNTYDGFGRLASSSINMGGVVRALSYQYDSNGSRTRITHPDGTYFTASYDGLNRQTWIHEQGVSGRVVAGYNAWGSLAGTSRSNATLTNYGYDAVQRPNAFYHDLGGSAADGLWTFARNPAGQIGAQTRENDAYAWTGHYAVSRPYTTDGLNRYTTAGPPGPGQATFAYDLNGNLTSDGARTFTYDVENRLVGASGGLVLAYDPLGRLFRTSGGASGSTTYLHDGSALVAEYNGAGTMTRRYVHWTGADVPMLSYAGTDLTQLSQLHADERGSILALSDANGAAAINRYDEYGIPASGNAGRFQYTGQTWLPDLGMYHYKARIYSPTLGRFMQTDPVGYGDQFNLYAYVGNDPINLVDPTGQWICARNSADQCKVVAEALRRAREALRSMRGREARDARRAIRAFGRQGVNNGVTVDGTSRLSSAAQTDVGTDGSITVSINSHIDSISDLENASDFSVEATIAHEGVHVADAQDGEFGAPPLSEQQRYDTERRAYTVMASVDRAVRHTTDGGGVPLWRPGMTPDQIRQNIRHRAWNSGGRPRRPGTRAW